VSLTKVPPESWDKGLEFVLLSFTFDIFQDFLWQIIWKDAEIKIKHHFTKLKYDPSSLNIQEEYAK
jgi:hypothetical protein